MEFIQDETKIHKLIFPHASFDLFPFAFTHTHMLSIRLEEFLEFLARACIAIFQVCKGVAHLKATLDRKLSKAQQAQGKPVELALTGNRS